MVKNCLFIYNIAFLLFGNILFSNIHYLVEHTHSDAEDECVECVYYENNSNYNKTGVSTQTIHSAIYYPVTLENGNDSPFLNTDFTFPKTKENYKELEEMLPNYVKWLKKEGNEKYGY